MIDQKSNSPDFFDILPRMCQRVGHFESQCHKMSDSVGVSKINKKEMKERKETRLLVLQLLFNVGIIMGKKRVLFRKWKVKYLHRKALILIKSESKAFICSLIIHAAQLHSNIQHFISRT